MCALIAWSSYWWHLDLLQFSNIFLLAKQGEQKGKPFESASWLQSFSCVLSWGVAFISMSVGLMHIQLVLQSPPLWNCSLCVSTIAVLLWGESCSWFWTTPHLCLFCTCLCLMATASQDWSCWCCIFNGVRRLIPFAAHLTPFQVGQSQLKQLCSFLWALSLLFTQPFFIFNLDFWNKETRTIGSSQDAVNPLLPSFSVFWIFFCLFSYFFIYTSLKFPSFTFWLLWNSELLETPFTFEFLLMNDHCKLRSHHFTWLEISTSSVWKFYVQFNVNFMHNCFIAHFLL